MEPDRNEPPTPVVSLDLGTLAASRIVNSRRCILVGWALIEATGAASAEVDFRDGQDATGSMLAPVALSPGQSVRDTLPPGGVAADAGLFAQVVSGSVRGTVYMVLA